MRLRLPWRRKAAGSPRQAWFEQAAARADIADNYFAFNGQGYSGTPVEMTGRSSERPSGDYKSLIGSGLKSNSIIFACERLRVSVFKQARFLFQELNEGRGGDLHNRPATRLDVLAKPWSGGSTADLMGRARLHADFAGNAFVARARRRSGLALLRPDWVTLVLGIDDEPGDPNDPDVEVIGYGYWPGGFMSGREPETYLADEVAHFAPFPDPDSHYLGMSWLNPVVTEFMADSAMVEHKAQFFRNGTTLQTVVLVKEDMDENAFARFMRKFNAETRGVANAYKTVYVTGGVDVKVVGADLKQLDFAVVQGRGESRVAACAGTPPILVGLSEGLSAGQYNIYPTAKRSFVDGTMRPDWADLCGALETLIPPPAGSRLWYDDDIPYLRDDARDRAEIMVQQMQAINSGVTAGFEPDDVVAAVAADDVNRLSGNHSGLYSVQLQPPMPDQPANDTPASVGQQPARPAQAGAVDGTPHQAIAARAHVLDDDDAALTDDEDLEVAALLAALAQVEAAYGVSRASSWNPADHARIPKGQPGGGRFLSMVERLKTAITAHIEQGRGHGGPDPLRAALAHFNRRQLLKAAKQRNIKVRRGIPEGELADLLIADLHGPPDEFAGLSVYPQGVIAKKIGRHETVLANRLRFVPPHTAGKTPNPENPLDPFGRRKVVNNKNAAAFWKRIGDEQAKADRVANDLRRAEARAQDAADRAARVARDAARLGAGQPPSPLHNSNSYHRDIAGHGLGDLQALVEGDAKPREKNLAGGAVGDTRLLTFPDGRQVVQKASYKDWAGQSPTMQADAEQLSSLVLRSMGLQAPRVYRNSDNTVFMEYVAHADAPGRGEAARLLQDSNEGRVLALGDTLITNVDRHGANWLIKDGHIVPIDHGLAYHEAYADDFGDGIYRGWEVPHGYFSKADIDEVRARLEPLRGDFERLGRQKWFEQMQARLDFEQARASAGGEVRGIPAAL